MSLLSLILIYFVVGVLISATFHFMEWKTDPEMWVFDPRQIVEDALLWPRIAYYWLNSRV